MLGSEVVLTNRKQEFIKKIALFQGYLTIVAYLNYFCPGTLKLQTRVHTVSVVKLSEVLSRFEPVHIESARRWLQKGESPYPGYCRAPGSSTCEPVLCNCQKLAEIWNRIKYTELKLKRPR